MDEEIRQLLAEKDILRERLEIIRDLHDPYDGPHTYCHECGGLTPCETRKLAEWGAAQ